MLTDAFSFLELIQDGALSSFYSDPILYIIKTNPFCSKIKRVAIK